MDTSTLKQFQNLFEKQKRELIYTGKILNEELTLKAEDRTDELDLTTSENETGMRLRLRNREALLLKKIEAALERIRTGTFGDCSSCGDSIHLRRLEARPTAIFCLNCKETQEQSERIHIDGHRSKSLGGLR
jgi:DnaK suppressor protein